MDGLNERFGGLAKAGQVNKRNKSAHGVGRERNKSAKKSSTSGSNAVSQSQRRG